MVMPLFSHWLNNYPIIFIFQLPLFSNIVNRATVNCARITGFDEKTCGSVIHEVNKILAPPTKNILEVINSDDKYSTLRQVLKDTEVEKILQQNNQSITFLAPTDETFSTLDEKDKKILLNDKEKANLVLKNHVLTGKSITSNCLMSPIEIKDDRFVFYMLHIRYRFEYKNNLIFVNLVYYMSKVLCSTIEEKAI